MSSAANEQHLVIDGHPDVNRLEVSTPMMDASSFKYIVADDHSPVILAVSHILSDFLGATPVIATNTAQLSALFAEPSDDRRMIILDLVMPGELKRVALVRAIINVDPAARIIVYTAEESAFLAHSVIEAGAFGYVAKTSPTTELLDALGSVIRGEKYVDRYIDLEQIKSHPWSFLTESERAVLVAFCQGARAKEIVAATGRSYSTVTTHKYNGLGKLGLRDEKDLLSYLYANGLLHELDVDTSKR
jgi:DNA-binding NarL/FixJ family response regulator